MSRYREIIPFVLSLFFLIVSFSLYYVHLAGIKTTIIVHFLGKQGVDVLGSPQDVLEMLIFGSVITALNIALAAILWQRNRALSRIIGIITILITLLILTAIYGIITVN